MTTSTESQPSIAAADRSAVCDRRLRTVLRINAATSGLGGLAAAVAPGPVDELLGTGQEGAVRLVGLGLVLFAVAVAAVSRTTTPLLRRLAPEVSLADAAWVVGTVITIALGWYSTTGAVVMAVVGVMVGAFAVLQFTAARHL